MDINPTYLDCAATTPLIDEVREEVMRYLIDDFGNAGSRTHDYGAVAKRRVQHARQEVADVVDANPEDVVFTSGATEANNLAILGLAEALHESGRTHIVTTAIEHKSVLGPVAELAQHGFAVDYVTPDRSGAIDPSSVLNAVRPETGLVSVMHVNNETGIVQDIEAISSVLDGAEAFLHVDGAQGFGKSLDGLREPRVDLISVSAHKVFGPKGVGALISRSRGYTRAPLAPLMFGGGQERGLRPGTHPVHLIAGFGSAARVALRDNRDRDAKLRAIRKQLLEQLKPLGIRVNGDLELALPNILSVQFPGIDSEALLVATRAVWAIATGSACTSQRYEPSHVLLAMGLTEREAACSVRISWSHLTDLRGLNAVVPLLESLRMPETAGAQPIVAQRSDALS